MRWHELSCGVSAARLRQRITQIQPRYAGYEQKSDRAIPVIRFSRADRAHRISLSRSLGCADP